MRTDDQLGSRLLRLGQRTASSAGLRVEKAGGTVQLNSEVTAVHRDGNRATAITVRGVDGGRIQNFGSWSPYMVKDGRTCLGLEYFVNEGDGLWTWTDSELVALATRELCQLGLVASESVVEAGYATRIPKAYPVYDSEYHQNVEVIRTWLEHAVPNVYPIGRNGMHRYNNQDHSMLTAMLTVENILTGSTHDVWEVNVEEDYHEESRPGTHGTGRAAPIVPSQRQPTSHQPGPNPPGPDQLGPDQSTQAESGPVTSRA